MLECWTAAEGGSHARCCPDEDSPEDCSLTLLEQHFDVCVSNCQQHQSNQNPIIACWKF